MAAFIDSHAHLDGQEYDADRSEVLTRAHEAGLTHILCIGASDGFESNPRTLEFVEGREGFFASVGIHPHDARILDDAMFAELERMSDHEKVVAIGETGLDYYYDQSPREAQQVAFRRFLDLGRRRNKPVIVHTRDAEADTVDIMRAEGASEVGGVLHCFTGTQALADAAVDMGWYVSFSGIITFKSAAALRDVARNLPRERVLIETDCPYLAPVPKRGKRNEPSFVVHTARQLAELWDVPEDEVRRVTGENALRLFDMPPREAPIAA